jgi:hypothetical protein
LLTFVDTFAIFAKAGMIMKRNPIYFILTLLLSALSLTEAGAQDGSGNFTFGQPVYTVTGQSITVEIIVDMSALDIHRRQNILLTPIISFDNRDYTFQPLSISGRTRYRELTRDMRFGNAMLDPNRPAQFIVRNNGTRQVHTLILQAQYESWITSAQLIMLEDISDCARCEVVEREHHLGGLIPSNKTHP